MTEEMTDTVSVYNAIAESYAKQTEERYVSSERDAFVQRIPQGGVILDVGCAAGRDTRYFHSKGYTVVGIDASEKLLEIAKQKAPYIDYRLQDIRDVHFPPNSFDGIYASAVLLHLDRNEVPQVLEQWKDILKPGGIVSILVKEGVGEGVTPDEFSKEHGRKFTYFQQDEIQEMVRSAGLHMEDIHQFNEKDVNPAWRDIRWISCIAKK